MRFRKQLLLDAKAAILAHPERVCMRVISSADYQRSSYGVGLEHWEEARCLVDDAGWYRCGTALCVAGWLASLSGLELALAGSDPDALLTKVNREVLQDEQEDDQLSAGYLRVMLDKVFFLTYWPTEEKKAYLEAQTPEVAAALMARRIDCFIEDFEREAAAVGVNLAVIP